jgi:hypothetical protein
MTHVRMGKERERATIVTPVRFGHAEQRLVEKSNGQVAHFSNKSSVGSNKSPGVRWQIEGPGESKDAGLVP